MKKFITLLLASTGMFMIDSSAQGWHTTGNTGTNPSVNFLGTIDSKALVFRTSNIERIRITSSGSTGVGINSPLQKLDVNGNINIRKGFSLYMENHPVLRVDSVNANTFLGNGTAPRVSGGFNTGVGFQSMFSNTSGSWNTGIGYQALYSNSTGFDNVAVGYIALNTNSSANGNTAVGNYALLLNNGNYNTATGTGALLSNSNGTNNVANGRFALYDNSSGSFNTAIGAEALNSNTVSYNTATGYRALYFNISGINNTANGMQSLYSNTGGHSNTAFGINTLYSSTGNYNTAVGDYALFNTTTAWGNTAVGDIAGAAYHNGYYNTFIGAETDATAADIFNSTALGRSTHVSAASQVRIGNSFVNSIGGYANWTNISDGRVKKNIRENVPGLAFIKKLKPVTYNLDLDAADKIIQPPAKKDKDGKVMAPSQLDITARNAKQQIIYTGFVAQDVEKAAKEINYDFSGVDAAKNDKDLYGLRYAEFVVPLVKAVQELSQQNDELKNEIAELKAMITSGNQMSQNNSQKAAATGGREEATLSQNFPNPFSQTTTVNYTLPREYSVAKIIVTDRNGRSLKEINLSTGQAGLSAGKQGVSGRFTIDASMLSSGAYQYTLYVDGKMADAKQMIVGK